MIAVVQRVTQAAVAVPSQDWGASIGPGLCVLLGVENGDDETQAGWMARKLARLRVFGDDEGKMNRSVQDIDGSVLLVSQFTLAGDCTKGNRPSFANAAAPELSEQLYQRVGDILRREHDLLVETGIFGAMMQVSLTNDGPVTLVVRR